MTTESRVASRESIADLGPLTMVIQRDVESGWLVGHLVELPGCYTQAPDIGQLETAMREVIELRFEIEENIEPECVFIGTFRIDIPT